MLSGGCGDDTGLQCPEGQAETSPECVAQSLDELVEQYESGQISRDEFRTAVGERGAPIPEGPLTGSIAMSMVLPASDTPYELTGTWTVPKGAILVIEQGASLHLAEGAVLDVKGRLYAVGSADSPIHFFADDTVFYEKVELQHGPNQLVWCEFDRGRLALVDSHPFTTTTLVESARFDSWDEIAIDQIASSGLTIQKSRFGYQTSEAQIAMSGEVIRSRNSGLAHIEDNDFSIRRGYRDIIDLQDCDTEIWPRVIGNRFDGGEDDAIDLDTCSAFVIGNHIKGFRPVDLNVMTAGVNGGGVTGDRMSNPVIINNLIDGCYHGIGFKNGATPLIINNTIINNNIGVTLYQSNSDLPMPAGTLINNILLNNRSWTTNEVQEIVLNGKWWPNYNQIDEVQGTIDARYNITGTLATPYTGDGNIVTDPMLDDSSGYPIPAANGSAIDTGLAELDGAWPMDEVYRYLEKDFLGTARDRSGTSFPTIDRGAFEVVP